MTIREEPLVSMITPVYNSEKYIGDTINSVLKQTYSNWEMLIAEDCSQDNKEAVIRQFKDSRIKYLKLRENAGADVARNEAIEKAKTFLFYVNTAIQTFNIKLVDIRVSVDLSIDISTSD